MVYPALTFELADESQTLSMAKCFAEHWPQHASKDRALVVNLSGDLGAGKTTFSRGFIQSLGHTGKVKSPTYTLIEPYELDDLVIVHMDLYRLTDPEELEYLGIDDLVRQSDICLIEWPERGADALPAPTLTLSLDHQTTGRQLQAQAHTEIGEVWLQAVNSHFPD